MSTKTIGQVVEDIRDMLQDSDATNYRWDDARVYRSLNMAFQEMWRTRRDLFLAVDFTLPTYTTADIAEIIPVDDSYHMTIVTQTVSIIQMENDAMAPDGKAIALSGLAKGSLRGGA